MRIYKTFGLLGVRYWCAYGTFERRISRREYHRLKQAME